MRRCITQTCLTECVSKILLLNSFTSWIYTAIWTFLVSRKIIDNYNRYLKLYLVGIYQSIIMIISDLNTYIVHKRLFNMYLWYLSHYDILLRVSWTRKNLIVLYIIKHLHLWSGSWVTILCMQDTKPNVEIKYSFVILLKELDLGVISST